MNVAATKIAMAILLVMYGAGDVHVAGDRIRFRFVWQAHTCTSMSRTELRSTLPPVFPC